MGAVEIGEDFLARNHLSKKGGYASQCRRQPPFCNVNFNRLMKRLAGRCRHGLSDSSEVKDGAAGFSVFSQRTFVPSTAHNQCVK